MFSIRYAIRPAFAAGAALSLLAGAGLAGQDLPTNFLDEPSKKWREGPVRYFLTKQEDELYKRLKKKEERKAFIYRFWLLRDPTPQTPANEFKSEFRQRVLDANRLFQETSMPGWKTDQGKVYILLGPPDEQSRNLMARTHRGIIIWTYRHLGHTTLGPNVVIAFARDVTGEFRLSTAPTLDAEVAGWVHQRSFNPVFGMSEADYIRQYGRDPMLMAAGAPIGMSELELQSQLGEILHLPPPEAILNELVTTQSYFDAIPFETSLNFYRAGDGATRATITLGIRSTAVFYKTVNGVDRPDVRVFARLLSPDKEETLYDLSGEGDFQASIGNASVSIDGHLVFQAARDIAPGTYTLLIGLEDRTSSRVGTFRRRVVVPDLSGEGLQLSSITLAERLDPLPGRPAEEEGSPYRFGPFRVVPRANGKFRTSEELHLYYQVYGARADETTGAPDLEITYTFHRREGNEAELFGKQTIPRSATAAQGFSIPLADFPVGSYQLEVSVTDRIGSETTVGRVLFEVI